MGLYKTSILSMFTFIKDNDLKFCPHSYSSCIYRMMRSELWKSLQNDDVTLYNSIVECICEFYIIFHCLQESQVSTEFSWQIRHYHSNCLALQNLLLQEREHPFFQYVQYNKVYLHCHTCENPQI